MTISILALFFIILLGILIGVPLLKNNWGSQPLQVNIPSKVDVQVQNSAQKSK